MIGDVSSVERSLSERDCSSGIVYVKFRDHLLKRLLLHFVSAVLLWQPSIQNGLPVQEV